MTHASLGAEVLDFPSRHAPARPIEGPLGTVELWDAQSAHLSDAELSAAVRDGVLVKVFGPLYAAALMRLSPAVRWAALARCRAALAEARLKGAVFSHATAAWAWLGGPAPQNLSVRMGSGGHRHREIWGMGVHTYNSQLSEADIADIESVRVSTPRATVVDLLCSARREQDVPVLSVVRLLTDFPERLAAGAVTDQDSWGPTPRQARHVVEQTARFHELGRRRQTMVVRRLQRALETMHPQQGAHTGARAKTL